MGLQLKTMSEVFTNLVDWITARTDKITDFNIGSAARTLSEAIAVQFEEFYFKMKQNVLYAIDESIYSAFGFDKIKSMNATGYVTLEFESALPYAIEFAEGTAFCTSSLYNYLYFDSTEKVLAPEGALSVMIPVMCREEGTIGNVPKEAITTIVTTHSIIKSVSNETAFTNGKNGETSYERKKRFQNYIRTLARGTADAITYGCLEVEGVAGAWVDDNYIGYVKIYAHDSDGELPESLRESILSNLENYRAGGIEVEVLPIVKKAIDLDLKIMLDNDYDTDTYETLLKTLIESNLSEYTVSKNFYTSDLIHTIKAAYDDIIVNIVIQVGGDLQIAENELIRPGEITVECIHVKDWRS